MPATTKTDILVTDLDDSGVLLVTGISPRGQDFVALLQEHGAYARGLWQCLVIEGDYQGALGRVAQPGFVITMVQAED